MGPQLVPWAAPPVQSPCLTTHSPPPSGCPDENRRDNVPSKGVFSSKAQGTLQPSAQPPGSMAPGIIPGSYSVPCPSSLPTCHLSPREPHQCHFLHPGQQFPGWSPASLPADGAAQSSDNSTPPVSPTEDRPGLCRSKFKVFTRPRPRGLTLSSLLVPPSPAPLLLPPLCLPPAPPQPPTPSTHSRCPLCPDVSLLPPCPATSNPPVLSPPFFMRTSLNDSKSNLSEAPT